MPHFKDPPSLYLPHMAVALQFEMQLLSLLLKKSELKVIFSGKA